jgi:hypothetical protein
VAVRSVHEHVSGVAEQSFFLELVLGLASAARRVEQALTAGRTSDRPSTGDDEHVFDYFLLGVISFSRSVQRHVAAAAQSRGGARAEPEGGGGKIRDLLL